jgi:hypothetical protein
MKAVENSWVKKKKHTKDRTDQNGRTLSIPKLSKAIDIQDGMLPRAS